MMTILVFMAMLMMLLLLRFGLTGFLCNFLNLFHGHILDLFRGQGLILF